MQDIYNTIIGTENITTYLAIAIAVLVIIFFLILFLGKKDKKLEETKKLQKIEMDGFKETSAAVKAETFKIEETTSLPVLETSDLNVIEETEVLPVINEASEESTLSALQDLTNGNIELPKMKIEEKEVPSISEITQDETEEPISLSELSKDVEVSKEDIIKTEEVSNELPLVEEDITLPEFNFDDVISSLNEEVTEITKEEPIIEETVVPVLVDEEPEIVIPALKEEIKEEVKKAPIGQPIFSSVYGPKKEEDDIIDLTNVGTQEEVVATQKVESNPSFDSILGETYQIK